MAAFVAILSTLVTLGTLLILPCLFVAVIVGGLRGQADRVAEKTIGRGKHAASELNPVPATRAARLPEFDPTADDPPPAPVPGTQPAAAPDRSPPAEPPPAAG